MTKDEALKMAFEAWFEKQYGHKPMPNPKQGDEPHPSVYMTMFADGAWKGWKASKEALDTEQVREDLPAQEPLLITRIACPESNIKQPAQEPVAWMDVSEYGTMVISAETKQKYDKDNAYRTPLYTHPHQWQGLTDDEISEIYEATTGIQFYLNFAHAIEQAHGIGVKE